MGEDSTGYVWAAIFWGVILGIAAIRGLVKSARDAARKRNPPTKLGCVELDAQCPDCQQPLKGVRLSPEDLARQPPLRAWRVCFDCGFKERAAVTPAWTRAQGDAIRAEERRREERRLIAEYEHRERLRKTFTRKGWLESTPQEFEYSVADVLRASGYTNVYVCGGPGDLTVDIQGISPEGKSVAIQCKRYEDKPVGSKELQTFIGMLHAHHRLDGGIYVTTSRFTKPAIALAEQHKIELIDGERLLDLSAPLDPGDADDHARMRSLEMWRVVQRERRQEAEAAARQAGLDRRRRARYWAHLKPR